MAMASHPGPSGVTSEKVGGQENGRVSELRSQVNEVKDVMSKNIDRVMERGDNLDNLVTKTANLEAGAAVFRDSGRQVRRKMWWKNCKMNLILAGVAVTIIIIIILASISWPSSSSPSAPISPVTTQGPS